MRKTRILCGLLVLALLLSLLPTLAAAAPRTLEEPAETKFRFNGHAVTDRSSFALNASDWTLGTFTDSPAVIRSGRTAGIGMEYRRALPERWYAQISVQPASGDNAGIALSGGGRQLVVQAGADNVLRAALDEQTVLEQPLTGSGTLTFVFDNTLGGEALGLYVWQGEQYCGGWELTEPDKALLASVSSIGFYAEQAGTIFSNFGVNTMIYAYENDPAAALAQVEAWAQQEVVGSIVKADNGVNMYTPDGVKNYDALWTRDFTYMLRYAGEYIPVSDAVACIEYLLENVHEGDCWLPDRVYGNGRVNYAAGDMDLSRANLDNNAFIVIAMDCALSRMNEAEGKALFEKWEATLMTALDALPKDENGLVYNDPLNPHSPYGFTDCICKTGSLMKESLLLWEAWRIMAKWQTAFGHDASVATAGAKSIEAVLVDTFRNSDGMLDAATVDCHQSDIWGSCYAVSIGFPLDESLKKSIADYIAANYCGLVQMGQLRHTAPGTYWQKLLSGVTPGEYQNGAYWATPTGWLIDTLEPYYPDLAMETLQDLISYYAAEGIYECVNGDYRKLIHYAASASNVLPAARRLLTTSPDLTGLELVGAQTAVVGAEKTYTLKLTPENVKITSYAWTANGTVCGDGAALTFRFAEAGQTVLTCTATDLNGNALTASLTVTVTQPDYPAITLTAGAVSGKAGDTVTVPYRLSSASGLAAAEFTLEYDAAQLEYVGMQTELAEVCSAHPAENGRVKVVLATAAPLTAEGTLLTAQFKLKQDIKTAYALPTFDTALCDYRDDSGTHPAQITVVQELVPPTQYAVTFVDGLTNETIATVEVEEGKAATAPAAPEHDGYTFKGWDKAFDNVTENLTVTALYEKNTVEYTVTFVDGLTKETIATVKVEEGTAATAPTAPEHEGYTFKGWDKAFDNVTENLTVTAIYEKNTEPEKPWVNPFKDVKEADWFYEGVKFANQHELFQGTAPDAFSPDDAMTRAMLVPVLWRLDGKTAATKASSFVDVPANEYYTDAVAWAAENGIVNGVDATHFAPNDEVTREQIAAILFRYAEKKGVDTTKRANLNAFPDANKVSSYAKEALAWANAAGLVKGSNENGKDYLDPTGSATRAQVATILARYAQNIVK